MYLHDQSQKIVNFGNSMLYLDFINPLQYHCSFQEFAKIVYILENICEEIVYIGYEA